MSDYPAEVERVLRMDPRVRDCAVVGKPDERLGEVPVAFIEPVGAPAEHELREALEALCADQIARYKIPTDWTLVRELPRNAMGKIVKPRLKERLGSNAVVSS
jgi:long-chain acyl-CoA synthetase